MKWEQRGLTYRKNVLHHPWGQVGAELTKDLQSLMLPTVD